MITSVHLISRVELEGRPTLVLHVDGGCYRLDGDLWGEYGRGAAVEVSGRRVLAPVEPSKIVAVGLNYRDHAQEMGKPLPEEPLIFLKPSTAVIGPGESIVLPSQSARVDHEGELGIVIGKTARRVAARDAADYILGLTCVNDVTARDLQQRDVQYTRAKGFDTFAPIGPCIAVGVQSDALDVACAVNGQPRQASNTRELIFSVDRLVEFITSVMTLRPGDVISTGTPAGVGPLVAGDRVTVTVSNVGELANVVASAPDA